MTTPSVDTSGFNRMCTQLARMASVPPEDAFKGEIGKVLENTLKNTRVGSAAKIRAYGSEFYQFGAPKKTYYMRNRYPSPLWKAMVARRALRRKQKLAARGLAKQSWLKLAQQLGTPIKAPGFVADAVPSTGRTYPGNTSVTVARSQGKLSITTRNSQPTANKTGARTAFEQAIAGREKFFLKNIQLQVFNDAAKTAKAYPGIAVKKGG